MRRLASTLLIGSACIACASVRGTHTNAVLDDEGAVYVYVEPAPKDIQPMLLEFGSLAALRDSGPPVALATTGPSAEAADAPHMALVALGPLPPGSYTGLSVVLRGAALRNAKGRPPLQVPSEPLTVTVPFSIARRRAAVVSLRIDDRSALTPDGRFTPAISATVPDRVPTGTIGLVTARGINSVTEFDKRSGRIVAVIPTGRQPTGIALDLGRNRAYVALAGEDAVEVLDILQNTVVDRVRLVGGDAPEELALSPDGTVLLVANAGSNAVSVIDPRVPTETGRITVGDGPHSVLFDPTGRRAYVFNAASDGISVIDVASAAVGRTIVTEPGPLRGQLSRRADRLYVIHRSSPYLTVIDTASLTVVKRFYVGGELTALKVDPQTDRILLARRNSDTIDVYDPLSLLPVDALRTGGDVGFLAIDGEVNSLQVVLPALGQLRIVPLVSKTTAAVLDVGEEPYAVVSLGER